MEPTFSEPDPGPAAPPASTIDVNEYAALMEAHATALVTVAAALYSAGRDERAAHATCREKLLASGLTRDEAVDLLAFTRLQLVILANKVAQAVADSRQARAVFIRNLDNPTRPSSPDQGE